MPQKALITEITGQCRMQDLEISHLAIKLSNLRLLLFGGIKREV